MREKKNFAQRSKVLASAEARKKYFLVYEGEETEQIYFDAVNEQKDSLGINPLIELVPIMRSYSEEGWSNPKKILDRVLLNLEEDEKKTISYETLLNWIMEAISNEKQFCEDDQELEHTVGSKVGLLLEELRKQ